MLGWKGFISSKCTKGKLNGIVRSEKAKNFSTGWYHFRLGVLQNLVMQSK